jgi:CDP-diacylglycerol--glycerol-3-phosphate 3-phosphatidyltransferase
MLLGIIAGTVLAMGQLRWSALILILGGLCDTLDGSIARNTEQTTDFGAFLDSTLDRYSDMALYLGAMTLAFFSKNTFLFLWSMLALVGAVMVSYTRARAECIIDKCQVGIMERPERIVLLLIGLLFHWLEAAMVITAILANMTALHRIYHTHKRLKNP